MGMDLRPHGIRMQSLKFMSFEDPEKSRWQKVTEPATQLAKFDVSEPILCWQNTHKHFPQKDYEATD